MNCKPRSQWLDNNSGVWSVIDVVVLYMVVVVIAVVVVGSGGGGGGGLFCVYRSPCIKFVEYNSR